MHVAAEPGPHLVDGDSSSSLATRRLNDVVIVTLGSSC